MSERDEESKMATAEIINIERPVVSAPPESIMIATIDLFMRFAA